MSVLGTLQYHEVPFGLGSLYLTFFCILWRIMPVNDLQHALSRRLSPKLLPWTALAIVVTNIGNVARAENLDHIRQLLSTKQCQNCDLQGASLVMANLQSASLSNANFQQANLSRVNLIGADLRNAKLAGSSLSGANLGGADLSGADLRNTDLRGTVFTGAILTGTLLDGATLQAAIDLPSTIGTAEQYYQWATDSTRQKRYDIAIDQFNQSLLRNPVHAPSYFGRSIAKFEIGDRKAAIVDMGQANELFKTQGDKAGLESSDRILLEMKKPIESSEGRGGNGLGMSMINIVGGLLRVFLIR
jgi:tetratricopeptide (TPR) repeat protein